MKRIAATVAIALLACAAPLGAAPVELKLKFPAGQTDHITMTTDSKQTISSEVLPAPLQQDMSMTCDSELKFLAGDAQGATAEMTYKRIRMSIKMASKEMAYDSDKKEDNSSLIAGPMSALVGLTMKIHFTSSGKIDQVSGLEDAVKKLDAAGAAPGAQMAKQFLNSKQMTSMLNSSFGLGLPDKPVNVGDTWKSSDTQEFNGASLKLDTESKLSSVDDQAGHQIAKIDFKATGKLDASNLAGGAKMSISEMKLEGTRQFDVTRGWFTESDTKQTMKADSTISRGGQSMTMKIEGVSTSKTVDTPAAAK